MTNTHSVSNPAPNKFATTLESGAKVFETAQHSNASQCRNWRLRAPHQTLPPDHVLVHDRSVLPCAAALGSNTSPEPLHVIMAPWGSVWGRGSWRCLVSEMNSPPSGEQALPSRKQTGCRRAPVMNDLVRIQLRHVGIWRNNVGMWRNNVGMWRNNVGIGRNNVARGWETLAPPARPWFPAANTATIDIVVR